MAAWRLGRGHSARSNWSSFYMSTDVYTTRARKIRRVPSASIDGEGQTADVSLEHRLVLGSASPDAIQQDPPPGALDLGSFGPRWAQFTAKTRPNTLSPEHRAPLVSWSADQPSGDASRRRAPASASSPSQTSAVYITATSASPDRRWI